MFVMLWACNSGSRICSTRSPSGTSAAVACTRGRGTTREGSPGRKPWASARGSGEQRPCLWRLRSRGPARSWSWPASTPDTGRRPKRSRSRQGGSAYLASSAGRQPRWMADTTRRRRVFVRVHSRIDGVDGLLGTKAIRVRVF